ncbi:MAG: hypothetical protein IJV00_07515 [Clostridia bacterium]|nr:hypothetical protein [Clostridia bacterium]
MKLNVILPGSAALYIDGKEQNGSVELDAGTHRYRAAEKSELLCAKWWTQLLNPVKFFGFCFFRDDFYYLRTFNSQAAALEFDARALEDTGRLELELNVAHGQGGYTETFHSLTVKKSSGLYISSLAASLPDPRVRRRWIALRLIPPTIICLAFFAIGLIQKKSLVIPFIYLAALVIHTVVIFKNKPILPDVGGEGRKK